MKSIHKVKDWKPYFFFNTSLDDKKKCFEFLKVSY